MKLPNRYGSIIKLSGNRRRPYTVRITTGYDDEGSQKRSTLGYYSVRKEASAALTEFSKSPYYLNANKATFEKIYKLILGHASKDITEMVYIHKTIQQLIDAINQIWVLPTCYL